MADHESEAKTTLSPPGKYLFPHLGWIAARAHTGWIRPIGPPRKINILKIFVWFFGAMEKMVWDGPKWDPRGFFPTNPDLAGILGRTDLDLKNLQFSSFCGTKISGFPGPQISQIWPGPGRAWTLGWGWDAGFSQGKLDCLEVKVHVCVFIQPFQIQENASNEIGH